MISLCPDARLLDSLKECNKLLEQVNCLIFSLELMEVKYKRTVTPNNIFLALLNLRFDYILVIIRTDWCKITIASIYIVKKLSLMSLKYDQFF